MDCGGLILLVLSLVFLSNDAVGGRWNLSKEEDMELDRMLKILNKPYIKSFKDKHGNIYDCVDIYKQPAFDHPWLKNHTIQMRPTSSFPKGMDATKPQKKREFLSFGREEGCPAGTVLIKRTLKEDLIRAKKYPLPLAANFSNPELHYAQLIVDSDENQMYYGAKGTMGIYEHSISNTQYTAAQILLAKGEDGPIDYVNALQFGWHIFYEREGDNVTHFYTYWTRDGYQSTGCLNLECPGFVQVSNAISPGIVIPAGEITLGVQRDRMSGNWLLFYVDKDTELIGYWPKEIFSNMADCSHVQMGGIVYSPFEEASPPMGTGKLPNFFLKGAAKFTQVGLMDGNGDFNQPPERKASTYTDLDTKYYSVGYEGYNGPAEGYSFEYGGPGGWIGP